ncbi:MAG: hypothetical protein PGN22_02825 [Agrobacterium cavarae]
MSNLEIVTVECIDTFDPPVVRVTIQKGDIYYAVDINSEIYPDLAPVLGWPTNPCKTGE